MIKNTSLFAMVLFMFSSLFGKTVIDKNFHQSYDVEPGASLVLKHGDGNVEVTTWSDDVVDITIVYYATFSGMGSIKPNDFEAEFEKRGDRITVIGREPQLIGFGSQHVREYKYTIKAPAYVSLDIDGVDGNVIIDKRDSDIKVESVDGNIEIFGVSADRVDVKSIDGNLVLQDIDADVRTETVDGNIDLKELINSNCQCKTIDGNIDILESSGNFKANSVDGNIKLLRAKANDIDAHTSDGRIEIDLEKSDNLNATLKSGDGNVRVSLASGTSVTLNIRTGDGRIRTDLSPVSNLETDDDLFRGSINGGSGSLSIRTGDGSVDIVEN